MEQTIMSLFMSSTTTGTNQKYHPSHYKSITKKNRKFIKFFSVFYGIQFACFVTIIIMLNTCHIFRRNSSSVLVSAFVARTPGNIYQHHHHHQQQQQQKREYNLLSLETGNIISNIRNNHNNNKRCFMGSTIRYAKSKEVDVGDEIGDISSYSKAITGYKLPKITWYPGHIARAERQLSEILKSVDVLIEVRDGRAPKATAHPMVGQWAAGKPRIVVLTHCDAVPSASIVAWQKAYEDYGAGRWDESSVDKQVTHTAQQRRRDNNIIDPNFDNDDDNILQKVESVIYVNAKVGKGIPALIRTIHKAGTYVHERRARRQLNPRSLRVGVLGFPNVGKSTLINKLLGGKKRAKTANTPGVTRSLQWIRIGFKHQSHLATNNNDKSFELLDSPGIIPSSIPNQRDALLLAACNSIGDASYDNQAVAAHLCEWVKSLHLMNKAHLTVPKWREICKKRYAGFDPLKPRKYYDGGNDGEMTTRLPTGEDFLYYVAENTSCNGDLENAARKILQDFRSGRWGPAALQLAPESQDDEGEKEVVIQDLRSILQKDVEVQMINSNNDYNEVTQERAEQAVKTAKELGLELPPMVSSDKDSEDNNESTAVKESEVGKGLFDGW